MPGFSGVGLGSGLGFGSGATAAAGSEDGSFAGGSAVSLPPIYHAFPFSTTAVQWTRDAAKYAAQNWSLIGSKTHRNIPAAVESISLSDISLLLVHIYVGDTIYILEKSKLQDRSIYFSQRRVHWKLIIFLVG